MLICPGCKCEYQEGMKTCPDCNLDLLDVDLITCQNCGENIESNFKYCLHCGFVLEDSKSEIHDECENHPGVASIGACVVCGKPVCKQCAKHSGKRIFCDRDEHLKIYGDFVLVSTCATEYEAQTLKSIIDMAGIECVLFSQKDHVFFSNVGNTAIVNVMVPKEDAEKVFKLIEEMDKENGDQRESNENE